MENERRRELVVYQEGEGATMNKRLFKLAAKYAGAIEENLRLELRVRDLIGQCNRSDERMEEAEVKVEKSSDSVRSVVLADLVSDLVWGGELRWESCPEGVFENLQDSLRRLVRDGKSHRDCPGSGR